MIHHFVENWKLNNLSESTFTKKKKKLTLSAMNEKKQFFECATDESITPGKGVSSLKSRSVGCNAQLYQ